jgi:glutathione peroxidase
MRTLAAVSMLAFIAASLPAGENMSQDSLYSFKTTTLQGKPADLSQFSGKVTLVVNVASQCGFTPQYAGLEKLHEEYSARGFSVLGFPSNDFGGQEPGDALQIRKFCTSKYNVTFPMLQKLVTKNAPEQSPVYAFLGAATGKLPGWNFCKYLVGKDGKPIAFYPSTTKPDDKDLGVAIDKALAAP